MKLKGFWYDGVLILFSLIAALAFTGYTAMKGDSALALAELIAIAAVGCFAVVRILMSRKKYRRMMKRASEKMDYSDTKVLSSFPFPAAVCDEDGFVKWCNDSFVSEISDGEITQSFNIGSIVALNAHFPDIYAKVDDKYFTAYTLDFHKDGNKYAVYCFIDITDLKQTEFKYNSTRPYVIVIETDNIDDSRSDFRDSEKSEIKGRMETMIADWCDRYDSVSKRISDDRLMIVTEKKNVDRMREDKFSILSDIRKFEYKEKNAGITISVGVSFGDTIKTAEKNAKKALDMALGRGGDQVAFRKEDGSYEFMGGVSRSAEKYSKTRARMRANKLAGEIRESSNVIICGHRFSDYDSLGASVGVAGIALSCDVPAYIVINKDESLAGMLISRLQKNGFENVLIDKSSAEKLVNRKTLFVMVDTNTPSFCECPEIFEKCERYAIIDHHRLSPSFKEEDAHLFHNPVASSACEIVTEYITYVVDDFKVSSIIAESLLSGIMLDTKNFISHTGVRTFQAAAYLKERGADVVSVNRLFANSMKITKVKSSVICAAKVFDQYAIASVPPENESSRLIAAKAADELLAASEVEASFVIYRDKNNTCISARSLGEVNVQLIMESMGGGGHQTMAACQLGEISFDEAEEMIIEKINLLCDKGEE